MEWLLGGETGEAKRLVKQLTDPSRRERAAKELIRMGAAAAPVLVAALGAKDSFLPEIASRTLAQMGAPAIPSLCNALASALPEIRSRTAEVLGSIGGAQPVPALIASLQGEYYTVRAQAALALGQIRDTRAMPALTDALQDPEPSVRSAAAVSLGQFADPRTFGFIGELLRDDPQIEVRRAAARALGETGRPEAIPDLLEALRDSFWWFERGREIDDLLDAITRMGHAVVPELIEALEDPEGAVRRLAAQLLGRIPDKRAIEPLTVSLYDTHFDVSRASAQALAAMGAPALPILLEALKHPEAWIRQQAAAALTSAHQSEVVPALLNLLQDEDRAVRQQVIGTLKELQDPRALPALLELAASRSDREFAALAKQAIKAIQQP